jgi:hypothetical protein
MNLMTDEQDRKVRLAALKIFSNLCDEWSILPEQSFGAYFGMIRPAISA